MQNAKCLAWSIVVNDECVYSTRNEILGAKLSATLHFFLLGQVFMRDIKRIRNIKQFVWIEFMNCTLVLQDLYMIWKMKESTDIITSIIFLTFAGEKNIESNCFLFWFSYCISILNRSPQRNTTNFTVWWKERVMICM